MAPVKYGRFSSVKILAEMNFDFLCARFVRYNDLTWHILPPFVLFFYFYHPRPISPIKDVAKIMFSWQLAA